MSKAIKWSIVIIILISLFSGAYLMYCNACTKTLYTKIIDKGTRISGSDKLGKFYRYIYIINLLIMKKENLLLLLLIMKLKKTNH